jgi:transketolase
MKNLSMRDSFFNRLYELAREDRNICIVSADMGAPSLDKFRKDLKSQFINVGIAEHSMVTTSAGLAMNGKKVFTYAIMSFVAARCWEMIKVDFSLMNLPVTTVGVGAGFSYDDSGPTHHSTDDLTLMRVLPGMTILNASDSAMAAACAGMACKLQGPSYVRLDRKVLPDLYPKDHDFSPGLSLLKPGKDLCIMATGNMVHRALEVAEDLASHSIDAGVIDLYRIKPIDADLLLQSIQGVKRVVTLEEHLLAGGMGSAVAELLTDSGTMIPLKRIGIQDRYYYAYGGRENIQKVCGLGEEQIIKRILEWQNGAGDARPLWTLGRKSSLEVDASHA